MTTQKHHWQPTQSGRPAGNAVYADRGRSHVDILTALMAVVVIISGIGGAKGVMVGFVITDAAFFLFPLAYILGDIITEVYGPAAARRAILTAFALNIFAVLCYTIIIWLPGFNDDYGVAKQSALELAIGPVWIIVLASVTGFLAGQSLNSFIVSRMKRRTGEPGLIARLFTSSGMGELVDTIIFCTIAATAIGITSIEQWANYTFFGFLYKVLVQYAAIPITATVIRRIKKSDPSYQAALRASERSGR